MTDDGAREQIVHTLAGWPMGPNYRRALGIAFDDAREIADAVLALPALRAVRDDALRHDLAALAEEWRSISDRYRHAARGSYDNGFRIACGNAAAQVAALLDGGEGGQQDTPTRRVSATSPVRQAALVLSDAELNDALELWYRQREQT